MNMKLLKKILSCDFVYDDIYYTSGIDRYGKANQPTKLGQWFIGKPKVLFWAFNTFYFLALFALVIVTSPPHFLMMLFAKKEDF